MNGKITYDNMHNQVDYYQEILKVEYKIEDTMKIIGENGIWLIEDEVEQLIRDRWEIADETNVHDYAFPTMEFTHSSSHPDEYVVSVKSRGSLTRKAGSTGTDPATAS